MWSKERECKCHGLLSPRHWQGHCGHHRDLPASKGPGWSTTEDSKIVSGSIGNLLPGNDAVHHTCLYLCQAYAGHPGLGCLVLLIRAWHPDKQMEDILCSSAQLPPTLPGLLRPSLHCPACFLPSAPPLPNLPKSRNSGKLLLHRALGGWSLGNFTLQLAKGGWQQVRRAVPPEHGVGPH